MCDSDICIVVSCLEIDVLQDRRVPEVRRREDIKVGVF